MREGMQFSGRTQLTQHLQVLGLVLVASALTGSLILLCLKFLSFNIILCIFIHWSAMLSEQKPGLGPYAVISGWLKMVPYQIDVLKDYVLVASNFKSTLKTEKSKVYLVFKKQQEAAPVYFMQGFSFASSCICVLVYVCFTKNIKSISPLVIKSYDDSFLFLKF